MDVLAAESNIAASVAHRLLYGSHGKNLEGGGANRGFGVSGNGSLWGHCRNYWAVDGPLSCPHVVVFVSHTHTPLFHLHTVLYCHIVQYCSLGSHVLFSDFLLFVYTLYIFILVPMHDNVQFEPCALQE